jgi:polysaccharide biosynthesis protein PelD
MGRLPYRESDGYLLDVAIAVGALALLNVVFAPSNPGFLGVDPHPTLVIAAVLGARWGLRQGVIAGAVLGALLLAVWALRTEIILVGSWGRLATWAPPLMTLGGGILFGLIGEVRSRQRKHLEGRLSRLQLEVADQAVRFAATTEAARELERRVADETESVATLYATARALDTVDVDQLYPAILSVTQRFVDADACQLYLVDGASLTLRQAVGDPSACASLSPDDAVVGLAIRRQCAVSVRDFIAVSAVEDLKRAPVLLAAPLVADGVLLGCLTVTRLPFVKLTRTAVDRLGVAAEWAARAIAKAHAHATSHDEAMTDAGVGAHSYAYYQRRLAEEETRAERYGVPLSVLVATVVRFEEVVPHTARELGRLLCVAFKRSLRRADLICRYAADGSFAIIMPETSAEAADVVSRRLRAEILGVHFRPYADGSAELELELRVVAVRARAHAKPRRRPGPRRSARGAEPRGSTGAAG